MTASVDIAAINMEFEIALWAENSPARANAVENCVPFIKAKPSLGPNFMGDSPAQVRASRAGISFPLKVAFPFPIMTAAMCANGARSPEAPTDP